MGFGGGKAVRGTEISLMSTYIVFILSKMEKFSSTRCCMPREKAGIAKIFSFCTHFFKFSVQFNGESVTAKREILRDPEKFSCFFVRLWKFPLKLENPH